jgi:hypothetical protein
MIGIDFGNDVSVHLGFGGCAHTTDAVSGAQL